MEQILLWVRLSFVYICSKVLWQDALPFTNSDTFGSPRPPPVPFWLGLCAPPLAPWISSALQLEHYYSTRKSVLTHVVKLPSPGLWQASFWHSCHFLVLCRGLVKLLDGWPSRVYEPHIPTCLGGTGLHGYIRLMTKLLKVLSAG